LAGVAAWNDYQFSVFFLQKPQSQTTSVALSIFFSQYTANISWTAAGCLVSALPATIAYLMLQKHFIKGLSAGALKM
jgi:raffinose/stachyose/melibiose transport system permease protein